MGLPDISPHRLGDGTPLAELTTMRVGGPAERLVVANDRAELISAATECWESGEDWLLLAGGSNTIVADAGYPGTVVLVRTTGIARIQDAELAPSQVRLRVQAGHSWDHLVQSTVAEGYAGIAALSGIPGLAGAAPVQNIGAYGVEVADVLHSVELLTPGGEILRVPAAELQLGYRTSALKTGELTGVILSLDLLLQSAPAAEEPAERVAYPQLATALGVELGSEVPLRVLRDNVLRLRAAKGMVLREDDHDTWSCGSFFTNPIVSERFARGLPADAPRYPVAGQEPAPAVTTLEELADGHPLRLPAPAPERQVKLSAAWLIEHAGIPKGYRLPGSGAALSSRHTLSITNRGGATSAQVGELARYIVQRVQQEFGVLLQPEPNLYGIEL